jgi:hypothetical protein
VTDLRGLAERESAVNSKMELTYDQLVSRIGMLMMPYAQSLGVEPQLSLLLVQFAAGCAVGLIREAEIERIRASVVQVKDERPTKE